VVNEELHIADEVPDPTDGDVIQCIRCYGDVMITADGTRIATKAESDAALAKAVALGFRGW
jgi:hypothetical protein